MRLRTVRGRDAGADVQPDEAAFTTGLSAQTGFEDVEVSDGRDWVPDAQEHGSGRCLGGAGVSGFARAREKTHLERLRESIML